MKLRLEKVLIETDHIESIERTSVHTVNIQMVSGQVIEVVCGVQTDAPTVWDQMAEGFIQTIQNTDYPKLQKENGSDDLYRYAFSRSTDFSLTVDMFVIDCHGC